MCHAHPPASMASRSYVGVGQGNVRAAGDMTMQEDGPKGRSRWGINLRPVDCPKCGQRQPAFRVPDGLRQLLWGGHTCPSCGCRMDKWGKPLKCEPPAD